MGHPDLGEKRFQLSTFFLKRKIVQVEVTTLIKGRLLNFVRVKAHFWLLGVDEAGLLLWYIILLELDGWPELGGTRWCEVAVIWYRAKRLLLKRLVYRRNRGTIIRRSLMVLSVHSNFYVWLVLWVVVILKVLGDRRVTTCAERQHLFFFNRRLLTSREFLFVDLGVRKSCLENIIRVWLGKRRVDVRLHLSFPTSWYNQKITV